MGEEDDAAQEKGEPKPNKRKCSTAKKAPKGCRKAPKGCSPKKAPKGCRPKKAPKGCSPKKAPKCCPKKAPKECPKKAPKGCPKEAATCKYMPGVFGRARLAFLRALKEVQPNLEPALAEEAWRASDEREEWIRGMSKSERAKRRL